MQAIRTRLSKAGYFSARAPAVYLILHIIPIPIMVWLGRLAGITGGLPLWIGILLMTLVNGQVGKRIKVRQKAFSKALFRIYRFIDLQLTAGIKVADALRGLPEAVRELIVHPVLVRFAALYELTLDLDLAFTEIRQAFPGPDSELLATHMRQCLQTGQAGRSLQRMEELLFARYFNMMQAETVRIRTRLLLTAMLGIFPGLVLYLYPLLFQAMQAVQTVFG